MHEEEQTEEKRKKIGAREDEEVLDYRLVEFGEETPGGGRYWLSDIVRALQWQLPASYRLMMD